MRLLVAAALLSALFAVGAVAQTTPPPIQAADSSIKAGTEEVVLDVVVRDKKGKLLNDLKPSDFTVTDNGEPRTIKSFQRIEGIEAVSSSGAHSQLDPLRQLRLITLVFQGGDSNAKKLARDAGMELVKTELGQNVYISVMAIDNRLQAIQSFTNDRDLLKQAINRATAQVNDYTNDTVRVRNQLANLLGKPESTGDASVVSGGVLTGPPVSGAVNNSAAQAMEEMMYDILQNATSDSQTTWSRATVFPLLDLVKEQYRLPGRKTILYFSGGFPLQQDTEDPFKSIISIANRANVSFYCVDINGLTTWSTNQNALSALSDAAKQSAKNVTSAGKGVDMGQAEAADRAFDAGNRDTQQTIARLSDQTGGALIANTNDFRGPIRKVVEEAESYYEITYDPQIQKYDGSFRKVAVKTDLKDVKVQTRAGYFALPPHMTQGQVLASYEVPLLQALDEKPIPRNFPFQSAAMHFRGANGPTCEVVVDIPVAGLTLEENKQAGYFEGKVAYVAMVKDGNGQVVKKLHQEIPLRITPDKLAAFKAGSHFIYDEGFSLTPGRYTLETAAIDLQNQKVSARKTSFVIPAQNGQLGISSVALIRNTAAKDATTKPDNPMLMADKVITPMVSPTLKKAEYESVPFYVTIYPDRTNNAKATLRMEFSKDGTALGAGSPAIGDPDADGRIQYVANAPLKDLPPGNYQVRFVVKQGLEEAAETVTFTIE